MSPLQHRSRHHHGQAPLHRRCHSPYRRGLCQIPSPLLPRRCQSRPRHCHCQALLPATRPTRRESRHPGQPQNQGLLLHWVQGLAHRFRRCPEAHAEPLQAEHPGPRAVRASDAPGVYALAWGARSGQRAAA